MWRCCLEGNEGLVRTTSVVSNCDGFGSQSMLAAAVVLTLGIQDGRSSGIRSRSQIMRWRRGGLLDQIALCGDNRSPGRFSIWPHAAVGNCQKDRSSIRTPPLTDSHVQPPVEGLPLLLTAHLYYVHIFFIHDPQRKSVSHLPVVQTLRRDRFGALTSHSAWLRVVVFVPAMLLSVANHRLQRADTAYFSMAHSITK